MVLFCIYESILPSNYLTNSFIIIIILCSCFIVSCYMCTAPIFLTGINNALYKWLPLFKPTTANFTGQWPNTEQQNKWWLFPACSLSKKQHSQKTPIQRESKYRFRQSSPVTWSQGCIHVYPEALLFLQWSVLKIPNFAYFMKHCLAMGKYNYI